MNIAYLFMIVLVKNRPQSTKGYLLKCYRYFEPGGPKFHQNSADHRSDHLDLQQIKVLHKKGIRLQRGSLQKG